MVAKLRSEVVMNLLIDIGNTRIKLVEEVNGVLSTIQYFHYEQLEAVITAYKVKKVKQIIFASVGNDNVVQLLFTLADKLAIKAKQVITEKNKFGVYSSYQDPTKLGIDRWLALLGAAAYYPHKSCLIIDAGTATTIDLLSSNKVHQGGWIIAGLGLMEKALFTQTAKIEQTEVNQQRNLSFANNTADNVKHGALAATIGAVYLAISQAKEQLEDLDEVLLLGGNADLIASNLATTVTLDYKLIFKGLQQYTRSTSIIR